MRVIRAALAIALAATPSVADAEGHPERLGGPRSLRLRADEVIQ